MCVRHFFSRPFVLSRIDLFFYVLDKVLQSILHGSFGPPGRPELPITLGLAQR